MMDTAPRFRRDDQEPPRFAFANEPLWAQYTERRFARELRSPRWKPLNTQVKAGVTWSDFNTGSFERLCEIDIDSIGFFVRDRQGESRILRLDVDHVLGASPLWIASILLGDASIVLATQLRSMGWHLWPTESQVGWSSPYRLIEPEGLVLDESPLATWRSDTPQATMIAVTNLFAHMLGMNGVTRLECRLDRCSPDEEARRKRDLAALGGRRRLLYDARGRTQNPILAYCAICGHALSDPTSAALGVGPECRRQSPVWFQSMRYSHSHIPPQFWIGCQPVESWKVALSQRRAVGLD